MACGRQLELPNWWDHLGSVAPYTNLSKGEGAQGHREVSKVEDVPKIRGFGKFRKIAHGSKKKAKTSKRDNDHTPGNEHTTDDSE
ncbi:hypothetical protein Hte_010312 [Hypoxylon texense]